MYNERRQFEQPIPLLHPAEAVQRVENASSDPLEFDSEGEDEDVIFVGVGDNGYPEPMGSLRNGLLKHDDDEISGNLCYRTTVRSTVLQN